ERRVLHLRRGRRVEAPEDAAQALAGVADLLTVEDDVSGLLPEVPRRGVGGDARELGVADDLLAEVVAGGEEVLEVDQVPALDRDPGERGGEGAALALVVRGAVSLTGEEAGLVRVQRRAVAGLEAGVAAVGELAVPGRVAGLGRSRRRCRILAGVEVLGHRRRCASGQQERSEPLAGVSVAVPGLVD